MKVLVGHTGLIGTTLKEKIRFDHLFNSKNIGEFSNSVVTQSQEKCDLYLCCLPATKWLVNKDPISDYKNMCNILDQLSVRSYSRIYLFSTIDVYVNSRLRSTERTLPVFTSGSLCYGENRYLFETMVLKSLASHESTELYTIRLPALYNKHLKKNVLFDLLNNHNLEKINTNSEYQWFDLDDIHNYIEVLTNLFGPGTYNLFPEPVHTSQIIERFFPSTANLVVSSEAIMYNFRTKYSRTGYLYDKGTSLEKMGRFIDEYRSKSVCVE